MKPQQTENVCLFLSIVVSAVESEQKCSEKYFQQLKSNKLCNLMRKSFVFRLMLALI